jgi:hypothetical protein
MNLVRRVPALKASWLVMTLVVALAFGCGKPEAPSTGETRKLTHEQTLEWIHKNRAWQRAKKTKPMWARSLDKEELGKEFQTADHAVERAREGYWLCVGIAGEPWFQKPARIEAKFNHQGDEMKQFAFDSRPRGYGVYKPKENLTNWVAQVKGDGIAGFFIKPNYDMDHPLYSPAGGYVVKDDVPDPYRDNANDVWLVQEGIFKSTYELVP